MRAAFLIILSFSVFGSNHVSFYQPAKGMISHYPYVNPNAPKGGILKIGIVGTFDTLYPWEIHKNPPLGANLQFAKLMSRSADEPMTFYGLIVQDVEIAKEHALFTLHPHAQWNDGTPITTQDVIESYLFLKKNSPLKEDHILKILPLDARRFYVIPDPSYFKQTLLNFATLPLIKKGKISGPYQLVRHHLGHSLVFRAVPRYWANLLPVHRGRYNFDEIHVIYYYNAAALSQALQQHQVDVAFLTKPLKSFPSMASPAQPTEFLGLMFNIDRLKNIHLRRAVAIAFEVAWREYTARDPNAKRYQGFFGRKKPLHLVSSRQGLQQAKNQLSYLPHPSPLLIGLPTLLPLGLIHAFETQLKKLDIPFHISILEPQTLEQRKSEFDLAWHRWRVPTIPGEEQLIYWKNYKTDLTPLIQAKTIQEVEKALEDLEDYFYKHAYGIPLFYRPKVVSYWPNIGIPRNDLEFSPVSWYLRAEKEPVSEPSDAQKNPESIA